MTCTNWLRWLQLLLRPTPTPKPISWNRANLLTAINAQRIRFGIYPLLVEWLVLDETAQDWAQNNANRNTLDHGNAIHRIVATLPASLAQGEILAEGQSSLSQLVQDWMASPGHKARILDPSYSVLGSGFATSSNGTPYFCVDFAG